MSIRKSTEKHKYLVYKRYNYAPIIIQLENMGEFNAYFAMYARVYNKDNKVNPERVLFWVCAPTREEVIVAFDKKYEEEKRFMNKRAWLGGGVKLNLHNAIEVGHF